MAQPGWYPDPGGQRGMFRYWDGSAWTQQLSADPGSRPPTGTNGKDDKNPATIWAILAGVVVLALIAVFALPQLFGGSPSPGPTRSVPRPTVSAWDETSTPTPSPTPTPTPRTPTPTPRQSGEASLPCPRYDAAVVRGRLFGGGLSVPVIKDSRWTVNAVRSIPWAVCATGLQRWITGSWVSEVILAGIQPRSMTGSLRQQAEAIAEDSVDRFYQLGKGRMVPNTSKAITLDGLDAWELRYQVRIDYLNDISGDNVNVVVVQHSDGSRSALLTFATIGDSQTQRQVDASRDAVKVEKR